jgi:hypothetical protein
MISGTPRGSWKRSFARSPSIPPPDYGLPRPPAVGLPPGATAAALLAAVAVSGLVFACVGWLVVRLNRRAVEADLLPYRRELEALLAEAEA